jgi:hypothetical protein
MKVRFSVKVRVTLGLRVRVCMRVWSRDRNEGEGEGDVLCAGAVWRVISDVVRDLKSAIKG